MMTQAEIDGLKAERDEARKERAQAVEWVIRLIALARAGDAATLASTTDAADAWLHRDEPASVEQGGDDTDAALGWAGAGAEASDPGALAQMREL